VTINSPFSKIEGKQTISNELCARNERSQGSVKAETASLSTELQIKKTDACSRSYYKNLPSLTTR